MKVRDRFEASISETEGYGLECLDPTLTEQSHKDDCDVNNILAKYTKTGLLPSVSTEGLYMDISEVGDYQEHMNNLVAAQEAFAALPSRVRERFRNNPAELVDFCSDPNVSKEELVELGLANESILRKKDVVPPSPDDKVDSQPSESSSEASKK